MTITRYGLAARLLGRPDREELEQPCLLDHADDDHHAQQQEDDVPVDAGLSLKNAVLASATPMMTMPPLRPARRRRGGSVPWQ
jgi:hypothetical protein